MSKIDIYSSEKIVGIRSVAIWLSEYSSNKQGNSGKKERIFLSPDLATAEEVDFHVDRRIKQLNEAREDAKRLII